MVFYAFIPARSGSKRIPHKNTALVCGKPLIQYSFENVKLVKEIEKIFVSTDDTMVKNIANQYRINIIDRPSEISSDKSNIIDVILHFFKEYERNLTNNDDIILLQPTSPLRTNIHIKEAIDLYCSKECDSVISVTFPNHSPYWAYKLDNNYLTRIFPEFQNTRSQDLPITYIPNGAIYIASVKTLKEKKSFYCDNIIPFFMNREDSVDIDEPIDIILVESILKMKENSS